MDRHAEIDGCDVEPEAHVRSLARTDLVAVGILLGDGIVLYATQPERKRRADVGEDVDGRSRIKRKFYLRIVTVGAIGAAALLAVGVVQEIRGARRESQFEFGEESETPLGIESGIRTVEDAERVVVTRKVDIGELPRKVVALSGVELGVVERAAHVAVAETHADAVVVAVEIADERLHRSYRAVRVDVVEDEHDVRIVA